MILEGFNSALNSSVKEALQRWTKSKNGKHLRYRLIQYFKNSLQPEELALCLAVMLIFRQFDMVEEMTQSRLTNSKRLADMLNKPDRFEESYDFMHLLLWSFWQVLHVVQKPEIAERIKRFLNRIANLANHPHLSPHLSEYNDQYLKGYMIKRIGGECNDRAIELQNVESRGIGIC